MASLAGRSVRTAVAFAAGLAFTVEVARQALAEHLEAPRPEASAQLVAGAGALGRLAEVRLRAGDPNAALAIARRSLAVSPLDVRALRVTAVALERLRQPDRAATVLAFAGRRSWRDSPLQARLVEAALRRQDFAAAMLHADALLRRTPEARQALFAFLMQASAEPRAGEALATRLATRPPWREDFLYRLAGEGKAEPGVTRVFRQLSARSGLSSSERGAFVSRLVRQARYGEADRAALAVDRARKPGSVFDPSFEGKAATLPFAWSPLAEAAVQIASDKAPGGRSGSALRVEWDGSGSGGFVRQLIVLTPGAYRLGVARFPEAGEPSRVTLRAVCAKTGAEIAAAAAASAVPGRWTRDAADLEVPAGCPAIWLVLAATAPGVPGTVVWFTDVTIERRT